MNLPAKSLVGFGLFLGACAGLAGCSTEPGGPPPGEPPEVTVSYPVERDVRDYEEYTGRTAAVESLDVKARVTGYLEKINFQEGMEVKENDVLYRIDPRPYQAALDQAEAQVKLQEANLKLAEAEYRRSERLYSERAIAREDLEKALASRDTARAQLNAAKANTKQAKLNVGFTKVRSPISGRVSRTLITRGNLVVADQTLLTTVVSQDPMYAYFDVDEPTALRIQELIRQGRFKSVRAGARNPVSLRLATEKGYPHEGYIDFVNNQADPSTATLQVRGVFKNPKPPVGSRVLSPGLFVEIKVAIGPPYRASLVSPDAIGTDQDLKFVFVLDANNRVIRRDVTLGTDHDGLTAIQKGVQPGERVIVEGIQHVRPGMPVKPKLVPMPVPAQGALRRTPPVVRNTPPSRQPKR